MAIFCYHLSMDFLSLPIVIIVNAFLTGLFTKLADIANDDGFKVGKFLNVFLGVLWGIFGSLVVLGSGNIGAFYFGILLSWIHRYKLDNYSHGIGGSIILVAIFFVHPSSVLQIIIAAVTFVLFTGFGLMSRHKFLGKSIFINYNIYSFIFLAGLAIFYPEVWLIFFASLANVIGYHLVKKWWKQKSR